MPVGSAASSSGASASDVRAGRAFVEVFGLDKLSPMLAKLQKRAVEFGHFMQKIGAASIAAGSGLAAPLAALLNAGIERADKIGDIAEVFDINAESASKMASAWEMAGGSLEEMETALSKLAAANKTGMPLDQMLLRVADALGEIDDASERFQAAQEIFGAKFARAFIDTGGDIAGLLNRGQTISPEEIRNAKEFKKSMGELSIALKSALLPALAIISPLMRRFSGFVRTNADLLLTVAAVAAGLVTFGGVMVAFGASVTGAVAAIGLLKGALLLLASPIGLISLTLVGLGALFVVQTETGRKMAADLGEAFKNLGEIFRDTWGGVIDAVKAGNLELAFKIVGVGIKTVWAQVMLSLRQGWNDFMVWTVDSLRRNPWILPLIGGVVGGLVGGGPGALAGATIAAGGAIALDAFADEIKRSLMADTGDAMKRLIAARGELAGLRAEAARGVAGNFDDDKYLMGSGGAGAAARMSAANFEATKGAFDTFRTSALRFGYGDTAKKELTLLEQIRDGKGGLADKIADAMAKSLEMR